MRAVVWHRPRKVSVDSVEDPTITEPTDAIIKVTATAICGSDLHLYDHGAALLVKPGDIFGYEPMGEVVAVGSGVSHISPGDRVVVPFNISCGSCFMCSRQLYSQCETTAGLGGKKGASLFGYTHMYGGVAGGQASTCGFRRLTSVRSRCRTAYRNSPRCCSPMSCRPRGRPWSTPTRLPGAPW